MLWKAFKRDKQWCVYKHDEEGQPVGETLGCHDTPEKADAQIAALHANVPEGKAVKAGARHSAGDRKLLKDIRDSAHHIVESAVELGADEKDVEEAMQEGAAAAGKAGDIGKLAEHLAKKFGGDPGFFSKCMEDEAVADYDEITRAGVCARAHKEAIGKWPGEKEDGKALDDLRAVKALGGNRIGHYAVLWGDKDHTDLTPLRGEWFTPKTEELTAIFKAMGKLPLLYHHAMDPAVKAAVVGTVDVMIPDDVGLWYEAQLDKATQYKQAIRQLVQQAALATSSGRLPGAGKVSPEGEVLRWPICEVSLTPMPMEPRLMVRPVAEIKAAYEAIGLTLPQAEPEAKGAEEARLSAARGLGLVGLLRVRSQITFT